MIVPRYYQKDAIDALDNHVITKTTNPCVVIPTGGGKSALIAWIIQRWHMEYPHFRCAVIAHRKELVKQNSEEFAELYPGCQFGVFCAGMRRKDCGEQITFASIDSIFRKAGNFPPLDAIIIDEAHRIPFKGEGKYLSFIRDAKRFNPRLLAAGFTATPYRMFGGNICGENYVLNEICYEINIRTLINDGYLLKLRSKVSRDEFDKTRLKKGSNGDYTSKSMSEVMNQSAVVESAVEEAVHILHAEGRRATVFFCVDVDHCNAVCAELAKWGLKAASVTNKTPQEIREKVADAFKEGSLDAVCNVNVYTEGFNAKRVDSVVLLRPTLSKGLYVQMVGRGSRLFPGLVDCLILDFAGCIDEHGPVDLAAGEDPAIAVCGECNEVFERPIGKCPACGWEIPKKSVERSDVAAEPVRLLHDTAPSDSPVLSTDTFTKKVDSVKVSVHRKTGKPNSMMVQYQSGFATYREWICPDHGGKPQADALHWLALRGVDFIIPPEKRAMYGNSVVNFALSDMFLTQKIKDFTRTITVRKDGKYWKIIGYNKESA